MAAPTSGVKKDQNYLANRGPSTHGTFEVADRPARQGRNPQTGAAIEIAASKAAKFKAGKGLKDALND